MKVLVCLFAVLALANAGLLHSNGLYSSGLLGTGSYISSPSVTYVQSAPTLHSVHVVKQPVYHHTVASTVYSAPVVSAPIVSAPLVSAPLISSPVYSAPLVSSSYGGLRYASSYSLGGPTKVVSLLRGGFLKHK